MVSRKEGKPEFRPRRHIDYGTLLGKCVVDGNFRRTAEIVF